MWTKIICLYAYQHSWWRLTLASFYKVYTNLFTAHDKYINHCQMICQQAWHMKEYFICLVVWIEWITENENKVFCNRKNHVWTFCIMIDTAIMQRSRCFIFISFCYLYVVRHARKLYTLSSYYYIILLYYNHIGLKYVNDIWKEHPSPNKCHTTSG